MGDLHVVFTKKKEWAGIRIIIDYRSIGSVSGQGEQRFEGREEGGNLKKLGLEI